MDPKFPNVKLKMTGEDGNAFFIIGRALTALRKAGVSAEEVAQFRAEAMGGDYDNVIQTCMKWMEVE